jgi:hypothetical protein
MYEVPVRFSSDARSDRERVFWSDSRFGKNEWRTRPRVKRSRRYLMYAGLLVGLCVLLAFVGCGSTSGIGELKATASGINFGPVTVGQASSATVSFVNSGAGAVQVSSVSVSGQPFKFMGPTAFPLTVAVGSTYSFQVEFSPSATGSAAGQVTVVSNVTTGGMPTVSLAGIGVQAGPSPATSAVLSGISCSNSSMVGAGTDNCFVALNTAAGSGGLTIDLTSNSTAVTVPATVTVPANTTGVGFTAKVAAVGSSQSTVLTASEGGTSESFALELNAALRILSASSGHVSFGYVALNSPTTQSLILTSSGTESVTISATSLTGSGFSVSGLAFPVVLNPGQVVVLNLQFDPAAAGSATGQLTITTNASSGNAMVIGLSGTGAASSGGGGGGGGSGTAPVLTALSCGSASMTGSGTDACYVTLSGAAPAAGVTVALASSSTAITVPNSVTVPGGAVSAGFAATAAAVTTNQTATLTATASGTAQTFAVQLNPAGAFLSVSQATIAFGNVSLNALGTQTLTLASTGTLPVTVNTAVLTGAGFTMSGITLPVVLNPGQSVTMALEFVPSVAGAATGQLTITSNATTGGTMAIPVSGTGAVPYEVNLAWDAPASSADAVAGYNVYRTLSGASSYQLLNSGASLTATTFTDTTVEDGQVYVYYVTSVDGSGVESVPSNAFDVTIP